jgi:hypothetical protein
MHLSEQTQIYAVLAAAGVVSLAVWVWLIVVPAWRSYAGLWQRCAATVLCVYVLGAYVLIGAGVSAAILWYYM